MTGEYPCALLILICLYRVASFLDEYEVEITRMDDTFKDIGQFERRKLAKEFKSDLKVKVTENLASNIYIIRIATFYTKIMEEGLLEKISVISSNLKKMDERKLGKY